MSAKSQIEQCNVSIIIRELAFEISERARRCLTYEEVRALTKYFSFFNGFDSGTKQFDSFQRQVNHITSSLNKQV